MGNAKKSLSWVLIKVLLLIPLDLFFTDCLFNHQTLSELVVNMWNALVTFSFTCIRMAWISVGFVVNVLMYCWMLCHVMSCYVMLLCYVSCKRGTCLNSWKIITPLSWWLRTLVFNSHSFPRTHFSFPSLSGVTNGSAGLYLRCQVFSENVSLTLPVRTAHKTFTNRWSWNEWLTLPIKYR